MSGPARSPFEDVKEKTRSSVLADLPSLLALSHSIHGHPELAFEEVRACEWVSDAAAAGGLTVEKGACDLSTALVGTAGSGPLVIAICAEYDALPEIGHACGHNVIAAAAVGAATALAAVADDLGITVKLMGTPAEEGGGGKIYMLERGAFEGVHAAMMVHPAPVEMLQMSCLAVSHFNVHYRGHEAHASAFPEEGVNAGDALIVAQVAIGLLRQQMRARDQVHGIVTRGGEAPNVIPAHTTADYCVRAATLDDLAVLEPRVHACFEAGALATGTTLSIEPRSPAYSHFEPDAPMQSLYRRNAEALGRRFPEVPERAMGGSTDMANVSLVIPSIHPLLGIDSLPAVNHQREFAGASAAPPADEAVRDGAIAMAWTVIDLATDQAERERLVAASA
jgi:amidohydrolase